MTTVFDQTDFDQTVLPQDARICVCIKNYRKEKAIDKIVLLYTNAY